MASSRDNFHTEERQNCPICLGDFKIPRQLPCMHSFCENCLQDYISSQEETVEELKQIECPICRLAVRPEQKGKSTKLLASLFPINVILQSIISESKVKVDRSCDSCHSAGKLKSAQDFCVECEEAMCENCSEVHRNQKISRNHVIFSMEEFTSNPQNVMMFAKGFSCTEHDGEVIDFYCNDHKTACCSKCCIVSHRNCANVSDLKKELPSLLQEMNPNSIIEQMKKLETHLKMFAKVNESNISLLESQVNNLTSQIRDLKAKLHDVLDELEKRVKLEGNLIYKEETIRKQEENHQCHSLINSIRSSHTLLETVKKYGTETQIFLMTEKMTSQLTSYCRQIEEKYMKNEMISIQMELDPMVFSIQLLQPDNLAKIESRKKIQSLPMPGVKKKGNQRFSDSLPVSGVEKHTRDRLVQKNRVVEIKGQDMGNPNYVGVAIFPSGQVMLADHPNMQLCLLDSCCNSVATYTLPGKPRDICITGNDEVAVPLPDQNTIQFLSVNDETIRPTRKITTRYKCSGVAAAGKKIVVSGNCSGGSRHYWSLIGSEGKEESCHEFDCSSPWSFTYIALDSSQTNVYITVSMADSLFCFGIDGRQKFVYKSDSLKRPRGVAADIYDNVYVVGADSQNIHQLTLDGVVLRIISDGVPAMPQAIAFRRNDAEFLITGFRGKMIIHIFILE